MKIDFWEQAIKAYWPKTELILNIILILIMRWKLIFNMDSILDYPRHKAVEYIQRFIGKPYIWGGQGPDGFDCSGLIIEVLRAAGKLGPLEDLNANSLYKKFQNGRQVKIPYHGCLVFWFKKYLAIHVEMLIDNFHTVGASGGGSHVRTIEDASKFDAFVKMRPIGYRGKDYKIIDVFKE